MIHSKRSVWLFGAIGLLYCNFLLGCAKHDVHNDLLVLSDIGRSMQGPREKFTDSLISIRHRVVIAGDSGVDSLYNSVVADYLRRFYRSMPDLHVGLDLVRGDETLDSPSSLRIAHQLRYYGNYNAARTVYAHCTPAVAEVQDIAGNLAMEYLRIGLNRSALKHALIADSAYAALGNFQGRTWTQRLLYTAYSRLQQRKKALECLQSFRTFNDQTMAVVQTRIVDTITILHMIQTIIEQPTWRNDLQIAFGANSEAYHNLYNAILAKYGDTWMVSWLPSESIPKKLPRLVIRDFPARSFHLAWTDSVVYSQNNSLAYSTRFGRYIHQGDRWVLDDQLLSDSKGLLIAQAKLPRHDTLYIANQRIRSVVPVGKDSLIALTRDSLIVIHGGLHRSTVLPTALRSSTDDIDIATLSGRYLVVQSRAFVLLLDRPTLKVKCVYSLRNGMIKGRYEEHDKSHGITILNNSYFLIRDDQVLRCFRLDTTRGTLNEIAITSNYKAQPRSTFNVLRHGLRYILRYSYAFIGNDTLDITHPAGVLAGTKYHHNNDYALTLVHAPRTLMAIRDVDNIDIVDTAKGIVYPQFALPIPIDASSNTDVGVFYDSSDVLQGYYHDGFTVTRFAVSQKQYPLRPFVFTRDNADNAVSEVSNLMSVELGHSYVIATRTNMVTVAAPILTRFQDSPTSSWSGSIHHSWYSRLTPQNEGSRLLMTSPIINQTFVARVEHSIWDKPWVTSLLQSSVIFCSLIAGYQVVAMRRRRRTRDLERAKTDQLELLREDMHDMIGSRLVRIASLARQASPENHDEVLARIHDMTIVTVRSLRNLLTLMSDSTMTDLDFYSSMREYVSESCKDAHIECSIDVNVNETSSHDNASRHELLMIISEMLTNTIRHASATHVAFSIRSDDSYTIITWSDNGTGFDSSAKRGNGLHNIERRAKRIKADVTSESTHRDGTRYTITFPTTQSAQS